METYLNKYSIASLTAIIATLLLMGAVMAPLEETATAAATVTINTFVDISLAQCPGGGSFNYGSHEPGATTDTPIACQDAIGTDGALRLTVEATTNTPVDVEIKGIDYAGPGAESIPVENTEYEDTAPKTGATTLTTSYAAVWSSMGGTGSVVSDDLWFWLDIPDTFLTAGSYTSTYTLKAS